MRFQTRVVRADDDTYTFECACEFTSSDWAQKKLATARGEEHTAEHDTGEPARELADFRADHGLNGPVVDLVKFDDAEAEL